MSARDGGGPAFPRPASTDQHTEPCNTYMDQTGMSLRDYFAGQVMAGMEMWAPLLAGGCAQNLNSETALQSRAEWAYAQADAMLAARARP